MINPSKLKPGDLVRLIAPSNSYAIDNQTVRNIARDRFETDLGLTISFGTHVEEIDDFNSSSIQSRIEDLHDAFTDTQVKAVVCIEGGFNSNQLLPYIDWSLIENNPKIFIGYSDITVLNNAIFAKTGLVNYSGPLYSTMGMKKGYEYNLEYFKKCLMSDDPFEIITSEFWSDDDWEADQENRQFIKNEGPWIINQGSMEGQIIGGNVSSLALLQGTEYLPDFDNKILFLEDDYEWQLHHIDRCLTGLTQTPSFKNVQGVVWGRFQVDSKVNQNLLTQMTKNNAKLKDLPTIGNVDFGHANPKATIPIGGIAKITISSHQSTIEILQH